MDNIEEKIAEIPAKKPRKPYTRQPKAQIPPPIIPQVAIPQAPNPNIVAMENKIAELVELRMQAEFRISQATDQLVAAQGWVQKEQAEFQRLEGQINYRFGLIAQMRGGGPAPVAEYWHGQAPVAVMPPMPQPVWQQPAAQSPSYAPAVPFPQYPPAFDPRMVPARGVGSIPGPNHGLYPDLVEGPGGGRVGSAEALRNDPEVQESFRSRGY